MREAQAVTILSVGLDEGLLSSRNAVLRHAGYRVVSARNRHEAILAAADSSVEIAVICFSFLLEDAHKLAHDLEVVNPHLHAMVLNDFDSLTLREEASRPDFLLHMVRAALTPRKASARR